MNRLILLIALLGLCQITPGRLQGADPVAVTGDWEGASLGIDYTLVRSFQGTPVDSLVFTGAEGEAFSLDILGGPALGNFTLTSPSETGTNIWFAADDRIFIADPPDNRFSEALVSAEQDFFANVELAFEDFVSFPIDDRFFDLSLNLGVKKAPILSTADFSGRTLDVFRLNIGYTLGSDDSRTFGDLNVAREQAALNPNGTFDLTGIFNNEGEPTGLLGSGTWGIGGDALLVTIPGEGTFPLGPFSTGRDIALRAFEESTPVSGGEFIEAGLEIFLNRAQSLQPAHIGGSWGLLLASIRYRESGGGKVFLGADFEKLDAELFPGSQTGLLRVIEASDPEDAPAGGVFSWTVSGGTLTLTQGGESVDLEVSAGHDTAVRLSIEEEEPGVFLVEWVLAVKKPDYAPTPADVSIASVAATPGTGNASATIDSVTGLYYAAERWETGTGFVSLAGPFAGDGSTLSAQDLSGNPSSLFRWRLVPQP